MLAAAIYVHCSVSPALEKAAEQHERDETAKRAEADKHAANKQRLETLGEYFK